MKGTWGGNGCTSEGLGDNKQQWKYIYFRPSNDITTTCLACWGWSSWCPPEIWTEEINFTPTNVMSGPGDCQFPLNLTMAVITGELRWWKYRLVSKYLHSFTNKLHVVLVSKLKKILVFTEFCIAKLLPDLHTLRCTRPPQSQSGAISCHLNHHCVVFKSAWQLWIKITERY